MDKQTKPKLLFNLGEGGMGTHRLENCIGVIILRLRYSVLFEELTVFAGPRANGDQDDLAHGWT